MNIIKTSLFITCLAIIETTAFSNTQKDTIYAVYTKVAPTIDGTQSDACWEKADWLPIDQVWIPYNAKMATGDFYGKYKVAWDSSYLYILAEITDDSLSDDWTNPLEHWWDDDCIEIFLDENRSKGDHLYNYNAFAYHVSTKYDVVDIGIDQNGLLLNDNLTVRIDTLGPHLYCWEFAIKIYDSSFDPQNPEASRIELYKKKLLGLTLAYCDNDQTNMRENFIGSMYMSSSTANDNYKNANSFGSLLLVDSVPVVIPENIIDKNSHEPVFSLYPNPAATTLKVSTKSEEILKLKIISVTGQVVKSVTTNFKSVDVSKLKKGIYVVECTFSNNQTVSKLLELR